MWNKCLLIASIDFKINSSSLVIESILQSFLCTHEYLLKPSSSRLISIWIYSKPHIFVPLEYINQVKCKRVLLGYWLTTDFRKFLTSLLWKWKNAVQTLIVFFLISFPRKIFLTGLLTNTLRELVSITHKWMCPKLTWDFVYVVRELIPCQKLYRPFKIKFNVDVRLVLNSWNCLISCTQVMKY